MDIKRYVLAWLAGGLIWTSPCNASNGIAIEAGQGNSTDMGRISFTRQWESKWFSEGDWYLTGYWEVSLGRWHSNAPGGRTIWDVGLTPVFRLQPKAVNGFRPYIEAAVGIHLIDHTHVNSSRDMSTSFQFGDHAGIGLTFGDRGQFDLGYRYQHLSNADIKKPNDGITFQQVRLGYSF